MNPNDYIVCEVCDHTHVERYDTCPVHGDLCMDCGPGHGRDCLVYNELLREDLSE